MQLTDRTRCLTVCQPFASLISTGRKWVENRTWTTSYRGPLLIHAGKSKAWLDRWDDDHDPLPRPFTMSAIVAVADVVASIDLDEERKIGRQHPELWNAGITMRQFFDHEHTEGPCCIVLANVRALPSPVRCNGAQGLWRPSRETLAKVAAQL